MPEMQLRGGELVLYHPPGSRITTEQHGTVVHVPGSFGVVFDAFVLQAWQAANDATLSELAARLRLDPFTVELAVTALRAAGLLLPTLDASHPRSDVPLPEPPPLVSIVMVSHNGKHHLEECLPSIMAQRYPRLEVILVDDRSSDGTNEWLQVAYPAVKIVQQPDGPNFASGNNLGIRHASGELILLLNNDTVLDPQCVRELVVAQVGRSNVGAVGAMLRFYNNRPFVNGLGTFVPRRRLGHDVAIGCLDVGQFERVAQVPLVCFGASLIPRAAFEKVGLIDEVYQFYYEDADWSYRARALGLALIAAPRAKVYHKFGASTGQLPSAFKMRLVARNRLRYVLKNSPAPTVCIDLAANALDDLGRLLASLARGQWPQAGAILRGWIEFIHNVPGTLRDRRAVQADRTRCPVHLSALNKRLPAPEMHGIYPRLTQAVIVARYQPFLTQVTLDERRKRVLMISPDTVAANMGGVGMRYWELAQVLAAHAQVTLAVPNAATLSSTTIDVRTYRQDDSATLKPLADACDVIVLSGFTLYHHPFLRESPQHRVIDLYDPTVLENLERFALRPMAEQLGLHNLGVAAYNDLLTLGDFFICASEKQRDYWLGALSATNRINPHTYAVDPTLRHLIDVVPFGVQDDPPQHAQRVLKGVRAGIGEHDKVIVWGGGLWDWLDPLTAIEAMPLVLEQVPQARLFFMGIRHPNPDVPASRMAQRAIQRATELGLKDVAVFFNDWTPYAQRANHLLESDIGLSLHGDHIETRFAVRTRVMDYVWASLPMVITGGDTLSDLIGARGLGRIVGSNQPAEVARALIDLLQQPIDRSRFTAVIDQFRWSRVAQPLINYVNAPWRNGETIEQPLPDRPVTPVKQLPRKALETLRQHGPIGLLREIRSYAIWRFRGS